ncbi:MAG: hypothetical protein ILNGONEN_00783 [Syntrophorhabdaceae bacterium]|nr:hypothetical protein [Syntrophorhabdaceae bacterium]
MSNMSKLPELEGNKIFMRHYALSGDMSVVEYFIDKDGVVNFLQRPSSPEKGFWMQFPADKFFSAVEKLKDQFTNISHE